MLLKCDNEILILDCGIPIKDIKIGLNFDISKVVGCVVTHSHSDHNKSINDLRNMGIPVFARYEHLDISDRVVFGNFKIISFKLPHNDTDNYGFYIKVSEQKILYLTDFEYCKFNFKSLNPNHIFVECNYQNELVTRNLPNYEHKIRGHCSLKTCTDFVKENATNELKTVLLLHMGTETTIPEQCITEVKQVVNPNVYVDYAYKNLVVELNTDECPF